MFLKRQLNSNVIQSRISLMFLSGLPWNALLLSIHTIREPLNTSTAIISSREVERHGTKHFNSNRIPLEAQTIKELMKFLIDNGFPPQSLITQPELANHFRVDIAVINPATEEMILLIEIKGKRNLDLSFIALELDSICRQIGKLSWNWIDGNAYAIIKKNIFMSK